jgi:hypothetical protein
MNWWLLLLIIFSSCADITLWGIFARPFPYLTRALFYTALGIHSSLGLILLAGLICSLQFFFLSGVFGKELLLLIPLGGLFYTLCSRVELPRPLLLVPVFCAVLVHSVWDWCTVGIPFDSMAVGAAFLSSLVMVYWCPGSQGNRSPSERKVRTPNERGTLGN